MKLCNIVHLECVKGEYVRLGSGNEETLFTGIKLVNGAIVYYVAAPFVATIKGNLIDIKSSDGKKYEFGVSQTKYNVSDLKKKLADCGCCAEGTVFWETDSRPDAPELGQQGYNTDMNVYEYWNGTIWIQY